VQVCEFGRCPRVLCNGQPCLPVGTADVPRQSTVKIFCPKCKDIYYPRSKYQGNVDGAYFGTTFPHLLLMTYPSLRPPRPTDAYTPRIFGFRLHASAMAEEGDGAAGQPAAAGGSTSRAAASAAAGAGGGSSTWQAAPAPAAGEQPGGKAADGPDNGRRQDKDEGWRDADGSGPWL